MTRNLPGREMEVKNNLFTPTKLEVVVLFLEFFFFTVEIGKVAERGCERRHT